MGLFHQKNVMEWYQKNKNINFSTAASRQKAEKVFQKCCLSSSQEELLEYVLVDRFWFIPIALKYMDEDHLIQYACRRPKIESSGYIADQENLKEDGEVLAIQRLHSPEAIAKLYLLYQKPGMNRFSSLSYNNKYGQKRGEALENRIGEEEAALIIRAMQDNNETIAPDDWIAQKITNDVLKKELGLSVTKEWAIDNYIKCPELKRAELLRSMLNDDEIIPVLKKSKYEYRAVTYLLPTIHNERFLSEYLLTHTASDINSTIYGLVVDTLPKISTPELLEPFLFTNPLHGYAAIYAIKKANRVEQLEAFRNKLTTLRGNIYQDEKPTHFLNRRPDPADDNLIILSGHKTGLEDIWRELNYRIKQINPEDKCDMDYLQLLK
ncbi:MAG: hypothetical protein K6F26_04780 [Lachnospiraceae bacterium]|nr:hypothetical protein [Lachnospiraceae bacterium]